MFGVVLRGTGLKGSLSCIGSGSPSATELRVVIARVFAPTFGKASSSLARVRALSGVSAVKDAEGRVPLTGSAGHCGDGRMLSS